MFETPFWAQPMNENLKVLYVNIKTVLTDTLFETYRLQKSNAQLTSVYVLPVKNGSLSKLDNKSLLCLLFLYLSLRGVIT